MISSNRIWPLCALLLVAGACAEERPFPPGQCPSAATPSAPGAPLVICVNIEEAAWEAIHSDPFARGIEVPVGLYIDGAPRGPAVIEIHGGYSRHMPKLSYRIKMRPGGLPVDLFGDGEEQQRRFVLQASWVDPSFLRNKLTFDLVRAAGGLAPRVHFAVVSFNGDYHGLYLLIERIDRYYLERQGLAPDGNLYKAEGNEASWALHDDVLLGFDHERGAHRPPDDLRELLEAVNLTPATAEAFAETVAPLLSFEDVFLYQRVHTFAMNRDAYSKNYLLHHDVDAAPGTPEARFRLITWDADATFGQRWDGEPLELEDTRWHGWDVLSRRLFSIPSYRDIYLSEYRAALAADLRGAPLVARVHALAEVIEAEAARDLARWGRGLDFGAEIERLAAAVSRRHEVMREVTASDELD